MIITLAVLSTAAIVALGLLVIGFLRGASMELILGDKPLPTVRIFAPEPTWYERDLHRAAALSMSPAHLAASLGDKAVEQLREGRYAGAVATATYAAHFARQAHPRLTPAPSELVHAHIGRDIHGTPVLVFPVKHGDTIRIN